MDNQCDSLHHWWCLLKESLIDIKCYFTGYVTLWVCYKSHNLKLYYCGIEWYETFICKDFSFHAKFWGFYGPHWIITHFKDLCSDKKYGNITLDLSDYNKMPQHHQGKAVDYYNLCFVFQINDILNLIGLSMCINTRCNRLSGGEAKRLSIALELVDNPSIMFLDEPTTWVVACCLLFNNSYNLQQQTFKENQILKIKIKLVIYCWSNNFL